MSKPLKNQCPPCAGFCVFTDDLSKVLLVNDNGFPKGKLDMVEFTDSKSGKSKKILEESLTGAFRELKEETGLSPNKIRQIGVEYVDELSVKGNPATRYYVAKIIDENTKLKPEDILEIHTARFVSIKEVLQSDLLVKKRVDVLNKALELAKLGVDQLQV